MARLAWALAIIVMVGIGFYFFNQSTNFIGYVVLNQAFVTNTVTNIEARTSGPSCYAEFSGSLENKGRADAHNVTFTCEVFDKEGLRIGSQQGMMDVLQHKSERGYTIRVPLPCGSAMSGKQYGCTVSCGDC